MNTIDLLHKKTLETLKQKFPQGEVPSELIAEMLSITKSAAYRRLDGKVPFTFTEMVTLAEKLRISLDEIIGIIPEKTEIFTMLTHNHLQPDDSVFRHLKNFINTLDLIDHASNSQIESISNILPYTLYMNYPHISRFYLFKWVYQYGHSVKSIPYREIQMNEAYRDYQLEFMRQSRKVNSSSFVLDPLTFYYLVNDVNYFSNLFLMTTEDRRLIQQDMFAIIEEMEEICINGHFKNIENEVFIYISNTNFTSNYCYMQIGSITISLIRAFLLNDLATTKKETFEKIKEWVQSQKRYATLISQSGEKIRIRYFQQQRKLIESLSDPGIDPDEFLFTSDYNPSMN